MKTKRQIAFLLIVGMLTSCASRESNRAFNDESLNHARAILDQGTANPGIAPKWPEVQGFQVRVSEIKSPEVWSLFEIRMHGDTSDLKRCLPYIKSKDNELRQEAEKTFIVLSRPNEKDKLIELLLTNDRLVHSLVLTYAGLDSAMPTGEELKTLAKYPDINIRTLAGAVMERKLKK